MQNQVAAAAETKGSEAQRWSPLFPSTFIPMIDFAAKFISIHFQFLPIMCRQITNH